MPKHSRTQAPPLYNDYKKYKPYLRTEFDYACVYCNCTEPEQGGVKKFQADHYKPQKKFKKLINKYTNLFYCCPDCNRSKWSYWPNMIQKIAKKIIVNPCDFDIDQHIDKTTTTWVGTSKEGEWTVERLRLDSELNVKIRNRRIKRIEMIKATKDKLTIAVEALSITLKKNDPLLVSAAQLIVNDLKDELDALGSAVFCDDQLNSGVLNSL